jgi:ribosome-binding protein aMBF1 (putative translation factor)
MPTRYDEDVAESRARETAEVTAFREAYAATLKLARDLRETRSDLEITQEALSERAGVTVADIRRIESGEIDSGDAGLIARMVHAMGRELEPLRLKVPA